MAEREPRRERLGPLGHLQLSISELEGLKTPKGDLAAQVVRTIYEDLRLDITSPTSPKEALDDLEDSPDLSERLNIVLSSFNRSPKTATFLRVGNSATRSELWSWFQETYVEKDEPRFMHNNLYDYITTLTRFGMVERVPEDEQRVRITHVGQEVGQPIAAKILSYERREQQSLYPIFGQVAVSDENSQRAPLTRAKILLELMQAPQGPADFSTVHQNPQTIVESLLHLQRAGMISIAYEQSMHSGVNRQYRILDMVDREKIGETKFKRKPFAEMIATACESLSQQGRKITSNAVFSILSKEYRDTHNERSATQDINHFLRAFTTDIHFLEDTSRNQAQEIMHSARPTPQGQHLVTELLLPLVDALQGGSILSEWRQELLPEVSAHANLSTIAQETFELYEPYSPEALHRNREVLKGDIVEYIRELAPFATNQDGEYDLRAEDISRLTQLSKNTVRVFTRELVAEGRLQREYNRRGNNVYRIPQDIENEI